MLPTPTNQDFSSKIPPADLASFQAANPGLQFGAEDYAQYNKAVTPSALTPATPLTPVIAPPTTPPIVNPYALTPEETKADTDYQTANTTVNDLLAQLDPSFRKASTNQQNANFGVQQKSDLYKSFTDRSTQLQAESQGIDLQLQQSLESERLAAAGKGVTTGTLGSMNQGTRAQANQKLLSNAIAKYNNNADMAASERQLSTAMKYAEQAVEAEFLPKEQALAIAQANLTNLKNSGTLTAAQQKRADARQAQIDEQKAANADAKKIKQDTSDARIKAIANNTGKPGFDSLDIAALNAATSPEMIAAILQERGLSTLSEMEQLDIDYKQSQIDQNNKSKYTFQTVKTYDEYGEVNGERIVALDPATGRQVGTVSAGGAITSPSGQVIGNTGGSTGGGVGLPNTGDSALTSSAKDWLSQFNSGLLTADEIYTKIGSSKQSARLKNEVARLIAEQGGKRKFGFDDGSIAAINSQIKNVNDLLNGDVGSIVGFVQGGLGVWSDDLNVWKQDALGIAKNLVSNQTLEALASAKSKGITFGALSEGELNLVAQAASRISAKIERKDKDFPEKITGFSGSEAQFKKDLIAVKEGLEKSIANKTGVSLGTNTQFAPDEMSQLDSMFSTDVNPANFY